MPLYVNDVKIESVPDSVTTFLENYPHFKVNSKLLCESESRKVTDKELLYVGQREFAGTFPTDSVIDILGSDGATTCHIAIFKETGNGGVCLCHFDGCNTRQGIDDMMSLLLSKPFKNTTSRIEVHLVGGFKDDQRLSEKLSLDLLNCLCQLSQDVHLITACITDLNTTYKNNVAFPVIYGLGINVKTGDIFKAKFPDKGPDQPLRSARHFTGGDEIINIYDHQKEQLCILPFSYDDQEDVDQYCRLPNHIIRQHLSTSPEQEPEGFEDSVRAAFIQIRDFPNPLQSHFANGKPRRYYKLPNGLWSLIE